MSEAFSSRAPLWMSAARPWHPPAPAGLALYEALRMRKLSLPRAERAARPMAISRPPGYPLPPAVRDLAIRALYGVLRAPPPPDAQSRLLRTMADM